MGSDIVIFVSSDDGERTEAPLLLMRAYCGLVGDFIALQDGEASAAGGFGDGDDNAPLEIEVPATKATVGLVCAYIASRAAAAAPQPIYPKPLPSKDLSMVLDEADLAASKEWDDDAIIALVRAANFLDCRPLVVVATMRLAASMMAKSVDEVRTMLGIERDMTDEEEDAFRLSQGVPPAPGREAQYERLREEAAKAKAAKSEAVPTVA